VHARLSPHIDAGTVPRTGASGARQAARTGTVGTVCDGPGRAWQCPRASRSTRRNGLGAGAAIASQRYSAGQGGPLADLPVCRDAQARRLLSCAAQGAAPRQPLGVRDRPGLPLPGPPGLRTLRLISLPSAAPRPGAPRGLRGPAHAPPAAHRAPIARRLPAHQDRLQLHRVDLLLTKVARARVGRRDVCLCSRAGFPAGLSGLDGESLSPSSQKGKQLKSWPAAKVLCRQPCSCLQRCCCSRSPTGLPVTDRSARPFLPLLFCIL
jgi:hypothetical protein